MQSDHSIPHAPQTLGVDDAWALVRGVATLSKRGVVDSEPFGVCVRDGRVTLAPRGVAHLLVAPDREPSWESRHGLSAEARRLLDLALPLCVGRRAADLVVAHLGQSLDGRVATPRGASRLITGAEDVCHTHRMRALFDAVVVGATTIAVDDPQLTTRLVAGEHPARVVLDPRGRLSHAHRVFTDGAARTLVVTTAAHGSHYAPLAGKIEVLPIDSGGDRLPLGIVRSGLRRVGLRRLFIEGGGVTVSRFMDEGLVDRLQIAVAPKLIGCGEPALSLGRARLAEVRSRRFLLGDDVLFDFDLAGSPRGDGSP